jgi:hypothetical protein
MRLISLAGPISLTSETHRILILGPSGADHQLQNALRALWDGADHVLFIFIHDHIFLIRWPRSLHIATV